jgi:HAD superfamily hydrolase (TIGR01509 family)
MDVESQGPMEVQEGSGVVVSTFCFDVGGVIIEDKLDPANALNVFKDLSRQCRLDPEEAYTTYVNLQPSLDLGTTSLPALCDALGLPQEMFERYWLSIHPAYSEVVVVLEQLMREGHCIGLATNICRRLLDLLIGRVPILSRTVICCSSDMGAVKPSPSFFSRAAELMRTRQIIFIDDRKVNIEAAQDFGWTAIQARGNWLTDFRSSYLTAR